MLIRSTPTASTTASSGETVRALTRDPSRIAAAGVDIVVADLRDGPAVERAMKGCEVVVLAAHGFVGPRGISPESIDRDANIAAIGRAAADSDQPIQPIR